MIRDKTISLVMIVKNEAHVIKDTLQNICNNIDLDAWYISDTGSTDGTQQIILDFFKEKNIPGELFNDEWKNFGHNRSLSMEHAFGKTDYILIFDADDKFEGSFKECIPKKMDKDAYCLTLSTCPGFFYKRPLIVNNKTKKFFYEGVLHEYVTCKDKYTCDDIVGSYHVHGGTIGNDEAKYARDAQVFVKALAELTPEDEHLRPRYMYYLAQSYRDARMHKEALEAFLNRAVLKNTWVQETYVSYLEAAKQAAILNDPESAVLYALYAHNTLPVRLEALSFCMTMLRSLDKKNLSYILYKTINPKLFEVKPEEHLFCHKYVYDWEIHYEFTIIAFYMNDFDVEWQYKRIYKHKDAIPKKFLLNCKDNLKIYIESASKDPKNKSLVSRLNQILNNFNKITV